MTIQAADEAQAMLSTPAVRVETGRFRDGQVEHAEIIEIPEAFFDVVQSAVLEQLINARNATLRTYPSVAADSIADRLAIDGVIDRSDATHVRDMVELEIKRGIEHLAANARDRYTTRLPVTLRSLIPLITRRSTK